jgi:hypothetical protein
MWTFTFPLSFYFNMRILTEVISVAVLSLHCSAGSRDRQWRDKLTSLLHEIDNKDSIDELGRYITSDEVAAFLDRSEHAHGSPEPPRRRGHPDCECPDSPGDALSDGCLNRRFNAVMTGYNAASSVSATYGFSSDTGRNVLRQFYQNLQLSINNRTGQTNDANKNITDPTSGYQAGTDRMLQRILNEETLMAQSVNSAWMSLINATTQTITSANTIQGLMQNSTQSMLTWFSSQQALQDSLSYSNMVRAVNYARNDLNTYVAAINQAQGAVWSVLTSLDKNMQGSEISSSALADALNSAADNLANKISAFNSSIPMIVQPTIDAGRSQLAQLLNQLQTYMNGQTSNLAGTATSKQQSTRSASTTQISNQATSAQQLLTSAQNQTGKTLDNVQALQDQFANISKTVFSNAATYVETAVQNRTNTLNTGVSNRRSNLTVIQSGTTQVSNLLSSYTNDEKTAVTQANTGITNAQNAANKALSDGAAAIDTKASQTLTSASTISTGAVAAVGTNFQSNMDAMGLNSNQLMSTLSGSANDAAKQASAAQSSLAIAASQGTAAISAASDTVGSQVQSAFKNILNAVGNIPGGIPATSMSSSTMLSVIQAAKTNMSAASDMVKQMFFGTQAGTMQNQTQAQAAIGNFLMVLQNTAPSADGTVNAIGQTIKQGSAAGSSIVSTATAQSQQNAQATSNAANQISAAQTNFANMLSSVVSQMATSGQSVAGGPMQGGLGQVLAGGSSALQQMQSQLNTAVQGAATQGQSNVNALAGASQAVSTAANAAQAQLGSASAALNQSVSGALGDINGFLASAQNSASAAVQSQISQINNLKSQSAIQVGQIDTSQMEQVRAVAASMDSLMNQVNSYLKLNGGPLYNDIQNLGAQAQKLFLYMNTLQNQHDRIQTDAADEGPVSWDDVLRAMLSALRADNATSLDALNKISATFNASASALASNISAQLSALTAQYANTASTIQTQLTSASNSALSNLSSTVGTISAIDLIKAIQQNVTQMASNATSTLTNVTGNLSLIGAGTMQSAFASVSNATVAAAQDAQFAASILAQVQGNATLQATNAQIAMQQNAAPAGDVQKAGSLSILNANMAQAQLAQQKTAIDKLLSDSGSISNDYAAEVQAQQQARQGQSSLVYDTVVAAKGQASAMLGKITQKMAQDRASRGSNVTMTQADQSIQIGLLRHAMTSMINVFDRFVSSVQTSFETSSSDRDGFVAALLGNLRQKMTQLDNDIYKQNQDLVQDLVDVGGTFDSYQNDPFDSDLTAFANRIQTWANSELQSINDQDNSIPNIVNSTTLAIPASLNTTINQAVLDVANTAKSILQKNGKTVPDSLNAYITQYQRAVR